MAKLRDSFGAEKRPSPDRMGVEQDTCCMGSKVVSTKSSPRWQQDQNAMQAMAKTAASKVSVRSR